MDRWVKIIIVGVVLAIIVFFGFRLFSRWSTSNIETAKKAERQVWQARTDKLVDKIAGLEAEVKELKGQDVPEEKLARAFGEEQAEISAQPEGQEQELSLAEIENLIRAFFDYLDRQDYVIDYALDGGTYLQFQQSVTDLSAKKPVVTGETEALFYLFRNMAHFYRVLGKKRIRLAKDVLQNEAEIMESVMQNFYMWVAHDSDADRSLKGYPSFETLYTYGSYFLNTLGGRSYLLRRDLKIRILTNYYCIQIIDTANDTGQNSNGIDIRPHIERSYNDIQKLLGLIHRDRYLQRLQELAVKYNM
jgi:hypothetical protein